MEIITKTFSVTTKGFTDIIDITDHVDKMLRESNLSEGNALVFAPGATAGITTIEYEPGLLKDYPEFFEKLVPSSKQYHHDDTWHDDNGFSLRFSTDDMIATIHTILQKGTMWAQ